MPLDLPPDSLGPKPTKKQMALLQKMAADGAVVHTYEGTRLGTGGAYIKVNDTPGESIKKSDVHKFWDYGWLEIIKHGFPGTEYKVTERARKRIQLGETR